MVAFEKSFPKSVPESSGTVDVVVLGAGVVGTTTAYALARRGLSVALVDRNAGPAMGTSFANGAQLSYAYSDALGSPGLLKKLPALLMGADPLFRLKPSFDPDFLGWGLQFLGACSGASYRRGTLDVLKLALESQRALHALLERHPITFGYAATGKMHLHFSAEGLSEAATMVDLKQSYGAEQHVLSRDEAVAIEPALRDMKGLVGVVYSPFDEAGDPYRFSRGLVEILQQHYGVRTVFGLAARAAEVSPDGVRVRGARGEEVHGRRLVVALGADAPSFLKRIGIRAPIQPMKGYSFTAPLGDNAPKVSLTDTARKLVFCRLSGRMRVAGGAELGDWSTTLAPSRLATLVDSARRSLPMAADYDRLESSWVGLRPMTPGSMPIISRPQERLVLNIGHGMLGWTLAMGSAERAAELLLASR
jgi:D-amino-acid dehydrogenase